MRSQPFPGIAPEAPDTGTGWGTAPPWRRRAMGYALLATLLALTACAEPHPGVRGSGLAVLLGLVGVFAGGIALFRERNGGRLPVAAQVALLGVVIAGSTALVWVGPDGRGFLGGFMAASMAATQLPRRASVGTFAAALVAVTLAGLAGAHRPLMSVAVSEVGMLGFYRVGRFAQQLRERTVQAERLMVELEQTRAAQLRAATLAERQRLAREMHDVLAHSLSGLLIHLEGARLLAVRESVDPRLVDTIQRAHHLAEAGLGEARQAIGMLRDEDLPGPERLGALAEEFQRDSGVRCELTTSGTAADLDAETGLTVYRVAQEALTNVRKHADPDRVELALAYRPDGISLAVEDFAATARPVSTDDHGYGLTGMRERAELLGGTLAVAPTGTGFRVELWVPAGVEGAA